MDASLPEIIRLANREFREFLGEVSRKGLSALKPSPALARIEKISARLEQVGQLLKRASHVPSRTEELNREIAEYEELLRELRPVLEAIQYTLVAERSHLQNIRANLEAASAWAATLRETS